MHECKQAEFTLPGPILGLLDVMLTFLNPIYSVRATKMEISPIAITNVATIE